MSSQGSLIVKLFFVTKSGEFQLIGGKLETLH